MVWHKQSLYLTFVVKTRLGMAQIKGLFRKRSKRSSTKLNAMRVIVTHLPRLPSLPVFIVDNSSTKLLCHAVDPKIKYQVTFSMLEIYMEAVDDLLVSAKEKKKGGLKVRQNPKLGSFYVDGLSKAPVASYDEISALMDKGTQNSAYLCQVAVLTRCYFCSSTSYPSCLRFYTYYLW